MAFTFNSRELIVNVTVDEVNQYTGVTASPPSGKCLVTNLYVDPLTGRLTVEYDNTPVT